MMQAPGSGAPPPQLVMEVKQKQREDPAFREAWWQFCDTEVEGSMRGTRDPARHTAATLERFLAQSQNGGTYDPANIDVEQSRLVNTVKKAQQDPHLKELWRKHCEGEDRGTLKGTRDPSLHPKETLQSFLDAIGWGLGSSVQSAIPAAAMNAGPRGDGMSAAGANMELVEQIKQGQRGDKAYREAWWAFCDNYAQGIRDPNRHPQSNLELFLSRFLDEEKTRQLAAANEEPDLYQQVKSQIKSDKRFDDAWKAFCDEHCNGIRDPMRHPEPNLKLFMETIWPKQSQNMYPSGRMAPVAHAVPKGPGGGGKGQWGGGGGQWDDGSGHWGGGGGQWGGAAPYGGGKGGQPALSADAQQILVRVEQFNPTLTKEVIACLGETA